MTEVQYLYCSMTFQWLLASQNPLIYLLVIPNTWTWTLTWSVMIPINLVFQMSDFRYEIKRNFVTCYLNWNIDSWKIRVGPYATNAHNWSWFLVDPVDDEDWKRSSNKLILQTSDNVRSLEIVKLAEKRRFNWVRVTVRRSGWSGRSCSSGHEIVRPETHWLVKTEVRSK